MRICDKCRVKHANHSIYSYDFCWDCLLKFKDWVECTTCNKEEGWVEEDNNKLI